MKKRKRKPTEITDVLRVAYALGEPVLLEYRGYNGAWCEETWQLIGGRHVLRLGIAQRRDGTSVSYGADVEGFSWEYTNERLRHMHTETRNYELPLQLIPEALE